MATLADQLRAQWGGNWNISGIDRAEELAHILQSKGINSLDGLTMGTGRERLVNASYVINESGQESPATYANDGAYLDFGGTQIGNFGDQGKGSPMDVSNVYGPHANEFGWSSAGDGAVGYSAVTGPDGKVRIVPNWNSSSDAAEIRDVALKAAMVVGGGMLDAGMLGSLGGGGTAVGNGAFLGEGVASGIPAWDAAAGMGGGFGSAGVGGGLADFGGYSLAAEGVGSMAPEMMAANGLDAATLYGSELGAATAATAASPFSWGSLAKAAIGPALSTGLQMYGANKAAGAMQDATNRANELDAPALAARNSALAQMQALLKDPSTITKSPDYQFGLDAGTKTLNNGAAARGMTYSGAQGKALQRYGQDYAGTKLDQSFNRLNALASAGQPGATQTSNNIAAQGNADAAKYLVGGNALGTAVNGLTAYGQRQGWWGAPG